jgi:hypothetical protein
MSPGRQTSTRPPRVNGTPSRSAQRTAARCACRPRRQARAAPAAPSTPSKISSGQAKPGSDCPPLRPDAPAPTRAASSRTTRRPARAKVTVAERPRRPPPATQTPRRTGRRQDGIKIMGRRRERRRDAREDAQERNHRDTRTEWTTGGVPAGTPDTTGIRISGRAIRRGRAARLAGAPETPSRPGRNGGAGVGRTANTSSVGERRPRRSSAGLFG